MGRREHYLEPDPLRPDCDVGRCGEPSARAPPPRCVGRPGRWLEDDAVDALRHVHDERADLARRRRTHDATAGATTAEVRDDANTCQCFREGRAGADLAAQWGHWNESEVDTREVSLDLQGRRLEDRGVIAPEPPLGILWRDRVNHVRTWWHGEAVSPGRISRSRGLDLERVARPAEDQYRARPEGEDRDPLEWLPGAAAHHSAFDEGVAREGDVNGAVKVAENERPRRAASRRTPERPRQSDHAQSRRRRDVQHQLEAARPRERLQRPHDDGELVDAIDVAHGGRVGTRWAPIVERHGHRADL